MQRQLSIKGHPEAYQKLYFYTLLVYGKVISA